MLSCIAVLKGTTKSNGFEQREKLLKESADKVIEEAGGKDSFAKTVELNSKDDLVAREEAINNELNKNLQDNLVKDINEIEPVNYEEKFKEISDNANEDIVVDDPDMSLGD
jgi:translation elongation factor EF-Ts